MIRPEHSLKIRINGRNLSRVVIDQHYKKKHADSINDQLILELVKELDGRAFAIEEEQGEFQYFVVDSKPKDERTYRLVLLLCISDDYLGVINAFRVDRRL